MHVDPLATASIQPKTANNAAGLPVNQHAPGATLHSTPSAVTDTVRHAAPDPAADVSTDHAKHASRLDLTAAPIDGSACHVTQANTNAAEDIITVAVTQTERDMASDAMTDTVTADAPAASLDVVSKPAELSEAAAAFAIPAAAPAQFAALPVTDSVEANAMTHAVVVPEAAGAPAAASGPDTSLGMPQMPAVVGRESAAAPAGPESDLTAAAVTHLVTDKLADSVPVAAVSAALAPVACAAAAIHSSADQSVSASKDPSVPASALQPGQLSTPDLSAVATAAGNSSRVHPTTDAPLEEAANPAAKHQSGSPPAL